MFSERGRHEEYQRELKQVSVGYAHGNPLLPGGPAFSAATRISHPVRDKAPRFAVEGEPPAVSDRLPRGFPRSPIVAEKPAADNRLPPVWQGRPLENILTKLGTGIVKGTGL